MKPWDSRRKWILAYMAGDQMGVDTLNSDFVMSYWEACEVKAAAQPYGAPKCPQLAKDLKRLLDEGAVKRHSVGLSHMAGMGFPRWVWSYELTEYMRPVAKLFRERQEGA